MTAASPRLMVSRYTGRCGKCGTTIHHGDQIEYSAAHPYGERAWCLKCSVTSVFGVQPAPIAAPLPTYKRSASAYTLLAVHNSASKPGLQYEVRQAKDGTIYCTCPDWIFRRNQCKHIVATLRGMAGNVATPRAATSQSKAAPRATTPRAVAAPVASTCFKCGNASASGAKRGGRWICSACDTIKVALPKVFATCTTPADVSAIVHYRKREAGMWLAKGNKAAAHDILHALCVDLRELSNIKAWRNQSLPSLDCTCGKA